MFVLMSCLAILSQSRVPAHFKCRVSSKIAADAGRNRGARRASRGRGHAPSSSASGRTVTTGGKEHWKLEVKPEEQAWAMEVAFNNYSADLP